MFASRIENLTGSLVREILQVAQQPEIISFAGGLPAPEIMPVPDFSMAPADIYQYGLSEGEPALRRQIAEYLQSLGMDCEQEQVLITSGSQQGIDLVAKLFVEPGTPVLVEAPTYLAATQVFRLFGAAFHEVPLQPDGIPADLLARAISNKRPAFAYLIPSFQNPTGYSYSAQRRLEIAAMLDEANIPLVEDEPYRELGFQPAARTPISAHLKKAPWIYLGSFSKTTCPGLRIGFLACSRQLVQYFSRLKQATDLHSNRIAQWWLAQFLAGEEYPAHLARLREFYRQRCNAMDEALHKHFGSIAQWHKPEGGLFFWVSLNQQRDTRLLLPEAIKRNVAFMPGEAFYANPVEQCGAMRLNFSRSTPEQIEHGVKILSVLMGAESKT
jgi:2-aminoadipate transaminase